MESFISQISNIQSSVQLYTNHSSKELPKDFIDKNFKAQIKKLTELYKKRPTDVINEAEFSLGIVITSTQYTPLLKGNLISAFLQLLIEVFEIIKQDLTENSKTYSGTFTTLVAFAFNREIPDFALKLFFNLLKIADSISTQVSSVLLASTSNDITHPYMPKFWSLIIKDYSSLSRGMSLLAKKANMIPETSRVMMCFEINYAFQNALKKDPANFGKNDMEDAVSVFEEISKWDKSYSISALVTLLLCMPKRTTQGRYITLLGDINEDLLSEKKRKEAIQYLSPAIFAVKYTAGNDEFTQIFTFLNDALVNAVIPEISNMNSDFIYNFLIALIYSNISLTFNFISFLEEKYVFLNILAKLVVLIEEKSPAKAYKVCKFLISSDQHELFDVFAENATFFIRLLVAVDDTNALICSKLEETQSEELLVALECLFNELLSQKKQFNNVLAYLNAFYQLYKKAIFNHSISFFDYIIKNVIAIAKYIYSVKNTFTKAQKEEIIHLLEKIFIYSLTSPTKEIITFSVLLASLTTDIGKNLGVEVSPLTTEIATMEGKKINYALQNPSIRGAFYTAAEKIPPHIQEVIENLEKLLAEYLYVVSNEAENTTKNTINDLIDVWENVLTILIFFSDDASRCIAICYNLLESETNTLLTKKITGSLGFAGNSKSIDLFISCFINDPVTNNNVCSEEMVSVTKNALLILNRFYEQPRNKHKLHPSMVQECVLLMITIATLSEEEPIIKFSLCQFLQLIDFETITNETKERFIESASYWISSLVINAPKNSTEALIGVIVSAISKASIDLKLMPDVLKKCISALLILLTHHDVTSILVQTTIYNMFKHNPITVLEETLSLMYSEVKIIRETLFSTYKMLIDNKQLSHDAIKKLEIKGAIDFVLETDIISEISETIPSSYTDAISFFCLQGAIIRGCEEEFISRMMDIELRNINDSNKNMVLRGNCISTRAIGNFMKMFGSKWVTEMFDDTVRKINERIVNGKENFEINPSKGPTNTDNFFMVLDMLQKSILTKLANPPSKIIQLSKIILAKSKEKLGDFAFTLMHGFFFLRFILPPLSVPNNLEINIKLDERTKEVLLNASVVLMSAVNKGDLNEKKEFYHIFNDFSAKTRDLFSNAIKSLLEMSTEEKPYDKKYMMDLMSEVEIENLLIPNLSLFYNLISKTLSEKPEFSVLNRTMQFMSKVNIGSTPQTTSSVVSKPKTYENEEIRGIMATRIPRMISQLVQNSFIIVDQNLFVFSALGLPIWPVDNAFIQLCISHLYDMRKEYTIILDFTGIEKKKFFNLKDNFRIIFSALPQQSLEKLKEVVLINCREQTFEAFNALNLLKKKLVNIEKCADFTTKYGQVIQYINDDFLSNETKVSTVVTLPQSSQTRTLYIYNKSLCIVKQDPSTKLLYVDAVLFSDISRIEQTTPEFIIVKSDGERYVLPISDEKFINALELAICKCIRSHYLPLIPHNIEMDLNVARAAAQEELSSMSTGERKTMMLEFFRLSWFMNSKIASETLLRSSGGFDLTNKLIADPETLEFVFSNVHFNL